MVGASALMEITKKVGKHCEMDTLLGQRGQ